MWAGISPFEDGKSKIKDKSRSKSNLAQISQIKNTNNNNSNFFDENLLDFGEGDMVLD